MDDEGNFGYRDSENNVTMLGQQIALYQFANPEGLDKIGDNLYQPTDASGEALSESTTSGLITSKVYQGYLEMSSVNVADEMVNMIVAQRAYEMNSKAIQTSDTMLEEANQLKR